MLDPSILNTILLIVIVIMGIGSIFKRSIVINNTLQYKYGENLEPFDSDDEED